MQINITFVGKVHEYAGEEKTILHLPESSDISVFFQELCRQKPELKEITRFLFVSVNEVMAPRHRVLSDGDQVALFFRMGGG